jgi:hypothetical protein
MPCRLGAQYRPQVKVLGTMAALPWLVGFSFDLLKRMKILKKTLAKIRAFN